MSLDIVYAYMESHPDDPFGDTEEILSWANGELAALREQVKVLREALKEAVGLAMEIVMKENALESLDLESALEQTKPKEVE